MAKEKEQDLGTFSVETREQQAEQRRVAPHLGLANIRFYQADNASDAPGAWYAIVHRDARGASDADVRLNDADAAALHAIAERLAKGKAK